MRADQNRELRSPFVKGLQMNMIPPKSGIITLIANC